MNKQPSLSLRPFLSLRYWPTWLGLGALWLLTRLPYRLQLLLGSSLGVLSYYVLRYRRHIAEVNLKLCFPELNDKQRKKMLKDNFASVGMGAFEMAMSWWLPVENFKHQITIHGKENYTEAKKQGKGTIFVGGHFTSLDLIGKLTTQELNLDVMYRPSKNKLIDTLLQRQRENAFAASIDRNNLRGMLRQLAKNRTVWYAPDQDYGRKYSVFAPFFGVSAASITATARLAKLSGAAIVPAFQYRLPNNQGYEVIIHPRLENFPSGDDVQDATRINQILEMAIRHAPEQYLWQHRRFKTRPLGEQGVY